MKWSDCLVMMLLIVAVLFIKPLSSIAQGQQIQAVQMHGVAVANSTSVCAAVPAVDTTVTLTAPSTNITIAVAPASSDLHIRFDGSAATTSNFKIPTGSAFTFQSLPPVRSFHIIGSGSSGTYSVFAH